jgi:hypothetical protein
MKMTIFSDMKVLELFPHSIRKLYFTMGKPYFSAPTINISPTGSSPSPSLHPASNTSMVLFTALIQRAYVEQIRDSAIPEDNKFCRAFREI